MHVVAFNSSWPRRLQHTSPLPNVCWHVVTMQGCGFHLVDTAGERVGRSARAAGGFTQLSAQDPCQPSLIFSPPPHPLSPLALQAAKCKQPDKAIALFEAMSARDVQVGTNGRQQCLVPGVSD